MHQKEELISFNNSFAVTHPFENRGTPFGVLGCQGCSPIKTDIGKVNAMRAYAPCSIEFLVHSEIADERTSTPVRYGACLQKLNANCI